MCFIVSVIGTDIITIHIRLFLFGVIITSRAIDLGYLYATTIALSLFLCYFDFQYHHQHYPYHRYLLLSKIGMETSNLKIFPKYKSLRYLHVAFQLLSPSIY